MRDASLAVLREIGVDTGGSNVQFAINPDDGRMVVIEMNPRVSRSARRWPPRPPASRSPRSPPSWPSATRSTSCATTSPAARRRPPSSRHRLRGHQDAALRLREVPAGRCAPDHADEVRGRGHGHRPHLPGVAAEGPARPGDRSRRTRTRCSNLADPEPRRAASRDCATPAPSASSTSPTLCALGMTVEEVTALRHRPLVPGADRGARRRDRAGQGARAAPWRLERDGCIAQAQGLLRPAPRRADRCQTRPRCASCATSWASARSTSAWTPAPRSSRPAPPTCTRPTRRSARRRRATRRRSWSSAAARTASARASSSITAASTPPSPARGRLRDHHGQLQPGDRVHRLRHLRPALLRALTLEDVLEIVAPSSPRASSCSTAARRR
jgi:hypothetical protein